MYLALYRKYRPKRFEDLIGQEHVRKVLQAALKTGRIAHAYMFTGIRGTGKTTTARLLAKALNCERGPTPEPCGKCSNCIAIDNGRFPDLIEIDAASYRGINEVREIRDNVKLAPIRGRYKVYIIDEVHMLTTEAFNALLKTLEEPPSHVVFILATTDPYRVPATVISRCQRFDFRRINSNIIKEYLKEVCKKEGINATDEALSLIARGSKGSLRDALSILDQLSNLDKIELEDVKSISGIVATETVYGLIRALLRHELKTSLELIREAFLANINMYNLIRAVIEELRSMIYYRLMPDQVESELLREQIELYNELRDVDLDQIRNLLSVLLQLLPFYRNEDEPIFFEAAVLRLLKRSHTRVSHVRSSTESSDRKEYEPEVEREKVEQVSAEVTEQTEGNQPGNALTNIQERTSCSNPGNSGQTLSEEVTTQIDELIKQLAPERYRKLIKLLKRARKLQLIDNNELYAEFDQKDILFADKLLTLWDIDELKLKVNLTGNDELNSLSEGEENSSGQETECSQTEKQVASQGNGNPNFEEFVRKVKRTFSDMLS